jgi:hypothetical protein
MAHSYTARLTLVHPLAASRLDPRLGVVIAETAATGRFIISDISWESVISPNSTTIIAYNQGGELKILEPLGMSLFDYMRAAAWEVGVENHTDARCLLEIEIVAENIDRDALPFHYIIPIWITATEAKSTYTEKGTEYNLKFTHSGDHAQSDIVQPIKEALTISAPNLKEFFRLLQNKLEDREYKYAAARQKYGSKSSPGGDNPAKKDDYHDEYHFILEPRLEKYDFTSKGPADRGVQGSWYNFIPGTTKSWNITMRPGTTIMQQIAEVMKSTKQISDLMPGKPKPATADASGSSDRSTKNMEDMLGTVYKFFRVETHSVYKNYDPIRGRYAVKHIFFIFLADQPTMYNYPDEIDLLNKLSNKEKVELRLKYYIQEGLLQKIYYYNYTGLNTDILKVDMQFNQSYALPGFPAIWADRGQTGAGMMNLQNYNRRTSPFIHKDDKGVRNAIADLTRSKEKLQETAQGLLNADGTFKDNRSSSRGKPSMRHEYEQLQKKIQDIDIEINKRKNELATLSIPTGPTNGIKNRSDLLNSLKDKFAEDMDFKDILESYKEINFPSLRARMEISPIDESSDIIKSENERLMEKLFAVQTSPRDFMELDLEIIGDPYWLGVPNILSQGKSALETLIELPSENGAVIKAKLNELMPKIDPEWNTKEPVWPKGTGLGGEAQWYKGSQLIYFNTQVPDPVFTQDDMLQFNANDQIVGIYAVKFVTNEFKNGLWTQKLKTYRDPTIPSYVLPRGLTGEMTFEQYMNDVEDSPERAIDELNKLKKEAVERDAAKASGNMTFGGALPPAKVQAANPKLGEALTIQRDLLKLNPAPEVNDPVQTAKELVASGKSKQEAYATAKQQYIDQVNANAEHMAAINKQAFTQANVTETQPYDAKTMASLALTRSDNGGLESWKFASSIGQSQNIGTAAQNNNPLGIGYDSQAKTYYNYKDYNEGTTAANEYFNYGAGVKQVGTQGSDRLLLPANTKADQLTYIKNKLKGGG